MDGMRKMLPELYTLLQSFADGRGVDIRESNTTPMVNMSIFEHSTFDSSEVTKQLPTSECQDPPFTRAAPLTGQQAAEGPTPMLRLVASLTVVLALLASGMFLKYMDNAPEWINQLVARSLKVRTKTEGKVRLSMLFSYHTDQWLSRDPSSKVGSVCTSQLY
eukprot:gene14483-20507_t